MTEIVFSSLIAAILFFVYRFAKDDLSEEGKLLLKRLADIIPCFEGEKGGNLKSALFCGYLLVCFLVLTRIVFG